jgi:3,4-dihydroxy 2-butanone 4-phosphate synthase / GTP cyclohydrolase II
MSKTTVEEAIFAVGRGEMIVVLDDEDRENEGDLIFAAEAATPDKLAFTVRHTSGIVCAALEHTRLDELRLPPMVVQNDDPHRTAFTVSVDYKHGTSTGISASDRSRTLRALADPAVGPADFARPGHIFPLRANPHGVLARPGHTEAAVDFAKLAGLRGAGVLCELVCDDGNVARRDRLLAFARAHRLALTTVRDLIAYRRRTESWVLPRAEAALPTRYGCFTSRSYVSEIDGTEHVVLFMGELRGAEEVLVRVHSECMTSEVFGSLRCDCRDQLEASLAAIAAAGRGAVVYLRGHEGRGIGLTNKLRAYARQDRGEDTVQANLSLGLPVDARSFDAVGPILRDLGVQSVRLLSNSPAKHAALVGAGVAVVARESLLTRSHEHNAVYLRAKREQLGHELDVVN